MRSCFLEDERESEMMPSAARAFDDPEKFDWSGTETAEEKAIRVAIDLGEFFFYAPNILQYRGRMLDLVNSLGQEGPSIRFTHILGGGLKLTRVDL